MQRLLIVLLIMLVSGELLFVFPQSRDKANVSAQSAGSTTAPQKIEGNWDAVLSVAGNNLRLVLKISPGPDGALKASVDSLDQPGAMDLIRSPSKTARCISKCPGCLRFTTARSAATPRKLSAHGNRAEIGSHLSFASPVKSNIPVLLISGEIDPVTPPWLAESAARYLPNSRHVVIRNATHTSYECTENLAADFIEKGSAQALDTSCIEQIKRPPFNVPRSQ